VNLVSHSAANNTFILSALDPTLCFAFDCLAGLHLGSVEH